MEAGKNRSKHQAKRSRVPEFASRALVCPPVKEGSDGLGSSLCGNTPILRQVLEGGGEGVSAPTMSGPCAV